MILHKKTVFSIKEYIFFSLMTLVVFIFCVTVGSVNISPVDTFTVIANTVLNKPLPEGISGSIILFVRLPRVICVALVGVALSLCGAAMQGLLRNPLADGSTIGVSSGASLGAVLAIGLGITIPGIPGAGTMVMAMIFAFISLMLILSLAYKLDFTLSTYTIILIGVIYSMFASSIISFIVTFAGDKVKTIVFWTMGSLAGTGYSDVIILLVSLVIFGTAILANAEEMNAFAIGEDNARHVGVNVKRVKLVVMISISALIGVSVSIGGTIGFVGLVIPHITRMLVGPNHKRLLPAVLFSGAIFLMLADLLSRVILSPLELPLGVVTSFIGSIIFVYIFYISRKVR